MKKSKIIPVESQTELTDQQISKTEIILKRFEQDVIAFLELLKKGDIALTGYILAVSYTKSDNTDTGAFGFSGNIEKVTGIVDTGIYEITKEALQTKKDREKSGGKIH